MTLALELAFDKGVALRGRQRDDGFDEPVEVLALLGELARARHR